MTQVTLSQIPKRSASTKVSLMNRLSCLLFMVVFLPTEINAQPPGFVAIGESETNRTEDVRWLQQTLNGIPHSIGGPAEKLAVDGQYGPLTHKAVARFLTIQLGSNDKSIGRDTAAFQRLLEFVGFPEQIREPQAILKFVRLIAL